MIDCGLQKLWVRITPVIVVLLVLFPLPVNAQQGGLVRYVYDNNGRLHAVISPNGEAAIYEYDPAGNMTAIRRNAAGTLEALGFSPIEGTPGTQVTIFGTGFGGGVSAVAFNGTSAEIVSINAPVLVVKVPDGATTGPITVTTPQGSTTTSQSFVVRGIKITPTAAAVNPGQTVQFSVTVYPTSANQSVTWSVNDIDGGNATYGTISAAGLYTPPTSGLFSFLTLRAKSVSDPNLFEDALVMVGRTDTATAIGGIGAGVLVGRPPVTEPGVVAALDAGVLVGRPTVTAEPSMIAALDPGVLVGRPTVTAEPSAVAALDPGVLVGRPPDTAESSVVAALDPGVLVGRPPDTAESSAVAGLDAGVLTTTGPYISAITPNQIARGASVTMTISGANLAGVTTIRFSNGSGGVDSNITVSNLNVNPNGGSLTATVTVGAGAALGNRLVVVSTATGNSLFYHNGLNTIGIVP